MRERDGDVVCCLSALCAYAGPSSLEEGSPYHLVKPRSQRDGRMFRPVILVASALALSCVVAVVVSSGPSRSVLQATGISSEVPLAMMPDPAEAVHVAQETVAQANAFHRGGSWIGKSGLWCLFISALFVAPPLADASAPGCASRRLREMGWCGLTVLDALCFLCDNVSSAQRL